MKTFTRLITATTMFLLLSHIGWGQAGNPCGCTENYLFGIEALEDPQRFFDPATIRKNGFRKATLTVEPQYREDPLSPTRSFRVEKALEEPFQIRSFDFDAHGFVAAQKLYSMGKSFIGCTFSRNKSGKLLKYLCTYSIIVDAPFQKGQIWEYNALDQLVRKTNLNRQGELPEEGKSSYIAYSYDALGRTTKVFSSSYSNYDHSVRTETWFTEYAKSGKKSFETLVRGNGTTLSRTETIYDDEGRKIEEMVGSPLYKEPISRHWYTYDVPGRLIQEEQWQRHLGQIMDCEEADEHRIWNRYIYGQSGLLLAIEHVFGKYKCMVRFQYK